MWSSRFTWQHGWGGSRSSHWHLCRLISLPRLLTHSLITNRSYMSWFSHCYLFVLGLPKNISRAIPSALRNPVFRPPLTDCGPTRSCPAGRVRGAIGGGLNVPAGTTCLGTAGTIAFTSPTVDGRPPRRLAITYSSVDQISAPPSTAWPSSFCQTFSVL